MKKQGKKMKLFSHILILSLVVIIAVAATFSWYNRSVQSYGEGNLLKYSQSGNVNGKGCTIKTYAGTNDKGKVTYGDTELTASSEALTTAPGAINYFKTVITSEVTDPDAAEGTVSVYLENFSYAQTLGSGNVNIGIIQPEKTYKSFSTTQSGSSYIASNICLEDNLLITKGSTKEIYWFVEVGSSTVKEGNITLGTMHLVYN